MGINNNNTAEEARAQTSTEPERSRTRPTTSTVERTEEEDDIVEKTPVQEPLETSNVGPSNMTKEAHLHPSTGLAQALLEATPPEVKSTVKTICADEAKPLSARITELANRIDCDLADKRDTQDILSNLVSSVANIKTHLECDGKRSDGPVESLVQSVRILRNDVNLLLEKRLEEDQGNLAPKGEGPISQVKPVQLMDEEPPLTWKQVLEAQAKEDSHRKMPEEIFTFKEEPRSKSERRQSASSSRKTKSNKSKKTPSRYARQFESSSSSSSSEDEKEDYFIIDDSSDEEDQQQHITFSERKKGPRHEGLVTIKPSNSIFDRLMNYRYYRLKDARSKRSLTAIQFIKKLIKSMDITFKAKFDGTKPILVLDFLSRFVEEADMLNMNEGQAYLILPHYLSGSADTQFRAMRSGARSGGISCWPELVQYFLSTYATPSAMREAVNNIRTLKQRMGEDEVEFGARINEAAHKCGNAFSEEDKMTYFVDGLHTTIQSIVSSWRETQSRKEITYSKLMLKARDEGTAYRARTENIRVVRAVKANSTRNVQFLEHKPALTSDQSTSDDGAGQVFYVTENSVATSELPSTIDESQEHLYEGEEQQQLLYAASAPRPFNQSRTVHPLKLAYANKSSTPNRVGWTDRTTVAKNALICHSCYEKADHISPNCTLGLNGIEKVVNNYNTLNESEKARVPSSSYKAAQAYIVQRDARTDDTKVEEATDQPKN